MVGSVLDDCKRETKLMLGYLVVIVAAVYKGQMLQFSSPRSECHVQTLQDKWITDQPSGLLTCSNSLWWPE